MTCVAGDKASQASSKLMGAVMIVLGDISMRAQRNTKRWVPLLTSRPAGDGLPAERLSPRGPEIAKRLLNEESPSSVPSIPRRRSDDPLPPLAAAAAAN